jgi:hypothetical protein
MVESVTEAAEMAVVLNTCSKELGLFEVHVVLCSDGKTQHKFFSSLSNSNTTLTSLCLGGSELNPSGAQFLASFISRTSTIISINASDCLIAEGVLGIVDAMLHNESITALDLSNNRISGSAASHALGRMIRQDIELEKLLLSHNMLRDRDVVDLLLALNDREAKMSGGVAAGVTFREPKINVLGGTAEVDVDHAHVASFLLDVRDNLLLADETALLATTLLVKVRAEIFIDFYFLISVF